MKDIVQKAVSLGLGLAVASKEQIEKAVEELVKKGEVSRAESSQFVEELLSKGNEARLRMEELVKEKVHAAMGGKAPVTKEDMERLEKRIAALEKAAQPAEEKPLGEE